ncbi:PAS domain S-box protein [Niastella caeni]|uniref:PAS domain S-box protein n=1 Tax=Niastella caeni TaxID=2569763 RepID=A0A4S8HLX3_9BACT|nr:PAS domain S-box protein [Niastella caeni]THU34774.1 PAS domain S-box protein [Niastella caeni]
MPNEDKIAIAGTKKDYYFVVINERGVIQCANDELADCIHIENTISPKNLFFNFLSPVGAKNLKAALLKAGFAATPSYLKMDLLNSSVHKADWNVVRLKTTNEKPGLFICIGHKTNNEKPTNKNGSHELANTPTEGILVLDNRGNVIDANNRAAILLNTVPGSLLNNVTLADLCSSLKIFTDPISMEDTLPMKTLLSGKAYEQVIKMHADCPESKWLHFTFFPLFDDTGSVPFSFVSLIKEIPPPTEQKPHDKELFQKEFLNTTSAMTWLIDDQERLIFANPAFRRFLGLTENDLNKKAVDVIPPFFKNIFEKEHRNVLATGIAHKKIYKHPLAGGTNIYFLVNIFKVPNNSNKQLLGGEALDITFGYNVHEEIARANERLIRLTQVTTEAIWEWDLQTDVVFRSKALIDLIGSSEIETIGFTWWYNRIHPDDRDRIESSANQILHNKLPSWQWEYRLKNTNGSYRTVRDRGIVVYEGEKAVKIIGSILDLTEIKELENQLMQEKIKHQKAIAKSIIDTQEKERTRLGQELHDNINQLLLVAKLYLGLLKPSEASNKVIAKKVMDSINMAITDIQAISREMVLPKLKEKTLAESIHELVKDVKMTCKFNIRFLYDKQATEGLSEGKKTALYRILQEQLKNTIQYSKANNVVVQLICNAHSVDLIVHDDGAGFDPLKKTKGIGLRNIYDRTLLYSGTVELQSSPGSGCRLKVTIPKCY